MAKQENKKCSNCEGQQIVKGMFGKVPCGVCNGLGFTKQCGEPYSEWQAITHFMAIVREQNKVIYLLKKELGDTDSKDWHDGRNKDNYRGD